MRMLLEHIDPNDIQDLEGARQAIIHILNLVEELASENRELREENQRLRDEINRLKAESQTQQQALALADAVIEKRNQIRETLELRFLNLKAVAEQQT